MVDDKDLVERAKRETRSFGPLYDRYVDSVYRFCYRRTGSHYDAEELTAQTFRRALEGLKGYQWRGIPFGAWLMRIAANLIADRGKRRTVSLDAMVEGGRAFHEDQPGPLDWVLQQEELSELWRTVYQLPLYQQQVLVLRYAQGMTTQEVARIVNRSESATKQLVYRSLKALRERLMVEE